MQSILMFSLGWCLNNVIKWDVGGKFREKINYYAHFCVVNIKLPESSWGVVWWFCYIWLVIFDLLSFEGSLMKNLGTGTNLDRLKYVTEGLERFKQAMLPLTKISLGTRRSSGGKSGVKFLEYHLLYKTFNSFYEYSQI